MYRKGVNLAGLVLKTVWLPGNQIFDTMQCNLWIKTYEVSLQVKSDRLSSMTFSIWRTNIAWHCSRIDACRHEDYWSRWGRKIQNRLTSRNPKQKSSPQAVQASLNIFKGTWPGRSSSELCLRSLVQWPGSVWSGFEKQHQTSQEAAVNLPDWINQKCSYSIWGWKRVSRGEQLPQALASDSTGKTPWEEVVMDWMKLAGSSECITLI